MLLSIILLESYSSNTKPLANKINSEFTLVSSLSIKKRFEKCDEYYDYMNMADSVLNNYSTKMTGKMMADAWYQTLENYNVDVPVRLALAQAHLESGFGSSDLAKQKNNPYSIRSGRTYATYKNIDDGVKAYYKLIASRYLKCKSIDQLLKNFTTCEGYRYAGSRNYEIKLKNQMNKYDDLIVSVR